MNRFTSPIQKRQRQYLCGVIAIALSASFVNAEDIKIYQVAKENSALTRTDASSPSGASDSLPPFTWTLPSGWEQAPLGELRLASFKVKGAGGKQAEVSVVALAGTGGGELNNVNRWRGTVGLAAAKQEDLPKLAESVDIGGVAGQLFDQAGEGASGDATRVFAAILHRADAVWFFKMMGDDDLVAAQKSAFVGFLKSIKFAAPTELPAGHPPLHQPSALPQGHPPVQPASAAVESPSADAAGAKWETPPSWTVETPTQMLLAKFSARNQDARAEITVSSFPGDVGGLLANVNRWRAQVGLGEISAAQLSAAVKSLTVSSESGSLVELENKNGKSPSLIGVAVAHNGQTWFFKLIGDTKVVSREKDAFIKFVQSVKLPNAT